MFTRTYFISKFLYIKQRRRRQCCFINGNNGSWTNTDDHKSKLTTLGKFKVVFDWFAYKLWFYCKFVSELTGINLLWPFMQIHFFFIYCISIIIPGSIMNYVQYWGYIILGWYFATGQCIMFRVSWFWFLLNDIINRLHLFLWMCFTPMLLWTSFLLRIIISYIVYLYVTLSLYAFYRLVYSMIYTLIILPILILFYTFYYFETYTFLWIKLGNYYLFVYMVLFPMFVFWLLTCVNLPFLGKLRLTPDPLYFAAREADFQGDDERVRQFTEARDNRGDLRFVNVRIRGGGKGNKMINNKVKNKGVGSKSKKKNDCKSSLSEEEAKESIAKSDGINNDDGLKFNQKFGPDGKIIFKDKNDYSNFTYAKHPNIKCTFTYDQIIEKINSQSEFVDYDCFGAPFCGMVCIDVAAKVPVSIGDYVSRSNCFDDLLDNGTPQYLESYASFRGFNFGYFLLDANDTVVQTRICSNSPGQKYIMLNYRQVTEECGHWTLACDNIQTDASFSANMFHKKEVIATLFGFINIKTKFDVVREFGNKDDNDVRNVNFKLDTIKDNPIYAELRLSHYLEFLGCCVKIDGLIDDMIHDKLVNLANTDIKTYLTDIYYSTISDDAPNLEVLQERIDFANKIHHFINCINGLIDYVFLDYLYNIVRHLGFIKLFFRIFYKDNVFLKLPTNSMITVNVSAIRRVLNSASLVEKINRDACLMNINTSRFYNDDANMEGVLFNTYSVSKILLSNLELVESNFSVGRVAVNAYAGKSILGNPNNFVENQVDNALRGGGNYIKRCNIVDIKVNHLVAVQPSLSIFNYEKQLGPGRICITDSLGVLMGFAGRSMSNKVENTNREAMSDFGKFFDKYGSMLIDNTDFSNMIELDPIEVFRKHYKGKKSQKYIDGVIKDYVDYQSGKSMPKDFDKNTCFVKMENSCKKKDGSIRTRPRLIMVMSSVLLIEYIHLLEIINRWNDGVINKFQVKHISPEEMVSRIVNITQSSHIVTDYSSFEASIIGEVRQMETKFMIKIAERAGFGLLKQTLINQIYPATELHCNGLIFKIDSRNSGRFCTSFMNGVVNAMINFYEIHLKNGYCELSNVKLIIEGDDGLKEKVGNEEQVCADLGFSFSDAVEGKTTGDVDFLRCRWFDGFKLLNVARCLKVLWVTTDKKLKPKRILAILRCAALSLYYMSPGHPILTPLIKRIGKLTSGLKASKGFENTVMYKTIKYKLGFVPDYTKPFPDMTVNDEMRPYIAMGAIGFPAIPIEQQIAIEKQFSEANIIQLFGVLDEYSEIEQYEDPSFFNKQLSLSDLEFSDDVRLVFETLKTNSDIISYSHLIKDDSTTIQIYEKRFM